MSWVICYWLVWQDMSSTLFFTEHHVLVGLSLNMTQKKETAECWKRNKLRQKNKTRENQTNQVNKLPRQRAVLKWKIKRESDFRC